MQKLLSSISAFAVSLAVVGTARAQGTVEQPNIPNPVGDTTLGGVLQDVINALLVFAGAVAVLFLIIGGFRYVVSTGNPDQVEGAKKTILYAVLGVIIIFIAFVLVNILLTDVLDVRGGYELEEGGTRR